MRGDFSFEIHGEDGLPRARRRLTEKIYRDAANGIVDPRTLPEAMLDEFLYRNPEWRTRLGL